MTAWWFLKTVNRITTRYNHKTSGYFTNRNTKKDSIDILMFIFILRPFTKPKITEISQVSTKDEEEPKRGYDVI